MSVSDCVSELAPFSLLAGKYRIQQRLGAGGMGTVYAAHHEVLDQTVAIKVLSSELARRTDVVKRLLLEARAAAKLRSEHVASVMDAGILDDGDPFMVMEYLEGRELAEVADRGPAPPTQAVDYLLQALEGLAHAHAAGIIHRDLKPTNLFLVRQPDGSEILKLVDFGISKSSAGAPLGNLTGAGEIVGSPAYMAPEQATAMHGGASQVDARTDVWSLGVVAFELLSGRMPFDGQTAQAVLLAVLTTTPAHLSDVAPAVPRALGDVVARCLARDPAQRWQDAAELARALAPFGSGAWRGCVERAERALGIVSADAFGAEIEAVAIPRGVPRRGRRPALVAAAALVAVALTATTAALAMRGAGTRGAVVSASSARGLAVSSALARPPPMALAPLPAAASAATPAPSATTEAAPARTATATASRLSRPAPPKITTDDEGHARPALLDSAD